MKKTFKIALLTFLILFFVTAAAIHYIWLTPRVVSPSYMFPSTINYTLERCDEDYLITVIPARQDPIWCYRFYLWDQNNKVLEEGECIDIYNVDLTFQDKNGNPISNVSLLDNTEDGKLSPGDMFVIRGVNNSEIYNNQGERVPGVGKSGILFQLTYFGWRVACNIHLRDDVPEKVAFNKSNHYNKWNKVNVSEEVDRDSINISTIEPAFSSYPPLDEQNISISVTLTNNGLKDLSNVSIKFFDNQVEIECKENLFLPSGNKARLITYYQFEIELINSTFITSHNVTVEVMYYNNIICKAYNLFDVMWKIPPPV